jgi:hypothetical protein
MHQILKQSLFQQFGAGIDMLENAIIACPDALWNTETKFWYSAYHCLFFLDYYLTLEPKDFSPPLPFSLSEFEDRIPERVYSKEELLPYLQASRKRCQDLITSLTEELALSHWTNASKTMSYPVFEILLYNMRHVQHHAAQLNLLLRQGINDAPNWIFRAGE